MKKLAGMVLAIAFVSSAGVTRAQSTIGLAAVANGQSPKIDDIGAGVSAPKRIKGGAPLYTMRALRAKLAGDVHVKAVVLPDGSLDNVHVVKSCLGADMNPLPHAPPTFPCVDPPTNPSLSDTDVSLGLNDAAVNAAKKWMFQPARRNGEAVAVEVELILSFRLH